MKPQFLIGFPSGEELEALCQWSNNLKSFQQELGKHFASSESRGAAFDYLQALLSPIERS